MTNIIQSLGEVAHHYDALFCDVWGCLHDGVCPYPEAVNALQEFRKGGGVVVLVTNSPRPWRSVEAQLDEMGAPRDCWDAIATSGDSARAAMFRGVVGSRIFFIGEDHDQSFFAPMDVIDNPVEISQVPLAEAEGIVCSGPTDPKADPSVWRPEFLHAKTRGLKLLCANPDIVVDRGDEREWCAGALAALYTEMGGESLYFGKPYPPIYDLARRRLAKIKAVDDARILCVGDGIHTDVQGGLSESLDTLFVTGGLLAEQLGTKLTVADQEKVDNFLLNESLSATAAIGRLR